MMATRPNKKELAQMKVMNELGHSPSAIAQKLGRSHHTVIKALCNAELFTDSEVCSLIETLREAEINDLTVLNAKARTHLHELIDAGDSKMIETIALMDRSFNQIRTLQNKATNVFSIVDYQQSLKGLDDMRKQIVELEKEVDGTYAVKEELE